MRTIVTLTLLCTAASAQAAVTQAEAVAKISATIQSDSKQAQVHLEIPDGVKFNFDGPWSLALSGAIVTKGKASPQFKRDTFDRERKTFFIPLAGTAPRDQLVESRWALTYFLCNKTGTWCKRLTAEGEFQLP
jgi:hypothetical protein